MAQFKRDFSTYDAPRPGRPRTVTTPEIIDQIHEIILKDRRINSWTTGHLTWAGWVHLSWRFGHAEALREVGLEMPELGSKTSTVPVFWETFAIFSARFKLFSVGSDWWPWTKPGYTTMTGDKATISGVAALRLTMPPKIPSAKIRSKSSRLEFFFLIKAASSSLIIFQRVKLPTRSLTYLCWCNWRTFWRKNAAGSSPRGTCACTTMPRLTGHLQPSRNWYTWASNFLITHPILRIWPRRTTACSWTEKKNHWKVATFRPTWRSLLPWRLG